MVKINKKIMCVVFEGKDKRGLMIFTKEELDIPNEILNLISFCPENDKSTLINMVYHADSNKIVKCPFRKKNCSFNISGFCLLAMHHDWWKLLAEEDKRARTTLKRFPRAYKMRKRLDNILCVQTE